MSPDRLGRPRRCSCGRPPRHSPRSGFDPPGLVTACRRILDRHPLSGPLWWLAARVLTGQRSDRRGVERGGRHHRRRDGRPARVRAARRRRRVRARLARRDRRRAAAPRRRRGAGRRHAGGGFRARAAAVARRRRRRRRVRWRGSAPRSSTPTSCCSRRRRSGPNGFIAVAGSRAAAATAKHAGVPVGSSEASVV